MKKVAAILGGAAVLALGLGAAAVAGGYGTLSHTISTITMTTGEGHTPVTICHKPGTPAEQELVVDDDSVELTGHLGHGDTIGPCPTETTPTDTTPTETTPTDTTPTTPTETTPTTPQSPRCPPGMVPTAGKDGQPGNDECEFPKTTTTVTTTPASPPAVTPPVTTQSTTTTPAVTAKPKPPVVKPKPPVVKPKPKPNPNPVVKVKAKKKKKKVVLTGNPKKDKCKDLGNGTMRCKGVVVTQGSG